MSNENPAEQTKLLQEAANVLSGHIQDLQESVENALIVRDELREVTSQTKTNRKYIWALAASLALDIILTVIVTITAIAANNNSQQIAHIQKIQTSKVLCPVYQMSLIALKNPAEKALFLKQGGTIQQYDQQLQIIQTGYNILDCKDVAGN